MPYIYDKLVGYLFQKNKRNYYFTSGFIINSFIQFVYFFTIVDFNFFYLIY